MMKRVMCVWLPHWPLQETLVRRPEWKEHPVVLYTTGGRGGWTVVSRSRKAAARGVAPGTPLAQAKALLDSAEPEPRYAEFDPLGCRLALRDLAEWCLRFSPVAGVEDAEHPECIFLDITGCPHLFGGEQAMAEHVVSAFANDSRHLTVRVGIADTPGAAWAFSHYANRDACVVPAGQHAETLAALPIEALRLPPDAAAKLRQLDVRTVGRLQALPRESLPSRFGLEVLRRLDQALGHVPELIRPVAPPDPVEAHWDFLHPTTERWALEAVTRKLLEHVAVVAKERNQGIVHLLCRFVGEQRQETPVAVRLLLPTLSANRLAELLRLRLDATQLPGDVCRIHVTAKVTALETCQQSLFDDADRLRRHEELTALIERLGSRLGAQAIVRPRWSFSPLPELAIRYICAAEGDRSPLTRRPSSREREEGKHGARPRVPAAAWEQAPNPRSQTPVGERASAKRGFATALTTGNSSDIPEREGIIRLTPYQRNGVSRECVPKPKFGNETHEKTPAHRPRKNVTASNEPLLPPSTAPFRPMHLFGEPASIEVMSIVPDGPPIRFRWRNRTHTVVRCWGPERIETGWWRGLHARRDYYRVETAAGLRFWLFRHLADGRWFLHGIYA